MKLADAMRALGLDETKLAKKFNHLVDELSKGKSSSKKMLLEVLRECGKLLEAYPASAARSSTEPVPVELVHFVPRPEREAPI